MTTPRRSRRRANGDGSLTRRADGRWMARYYAWTTTGTRKRITIYAPTRQQAADQLRQAQERNRQGIPVPDKTWKLGDWLDYWLANVVVLNRRAATYQLYEITSRLYLKPHLGSIPLNRLSVAKVQSFLNGQIAAGQSVRQVQVMRAVLSSALTRAMREELIVRNVARLTELPTWERQPIRPWTPDEARQFLRAAREDPFYHAFVLLLLYGLRRGEVLGLRWQDIDYEAGEIRVRQQIQRLQGEIQAGSVKTAAGRRELPLLPLAREVLDMRITAQASDRAEFGLAWTDNGLIFTTRSGRPIDPRNFARSFHRICAGGNLRQITLHHLRHTTATLLKNLGVPARDAQLILGHSRLSVTLEIYSHEDREARQQALTKIGDVLNPTLPGGP